MTDASPNGSNIVAAFAAFVRQRLADVGGTVRDTVSAPLAPLLRRDGKDVVSARDGNAAHRRSIAMVIVAAAAPFAPTAHARARLLRQAHASGLLSARETDDALGVLRAIGAPRS